LTDQPPPITIDQAPESLPRPEEPVLRSSRSAAPPDPATAGSWCASCGQPVGGQQAMTTRMATSGPVYAVGRIQARFPSLGVEKEYAQLTGGDPHALVQVADLKTALTQSENRYLARKMCWIFSVHTADVCVIIPRYDSDLDELINMLESDDTDIVQALVAAPNLELPDAACAASGLPPVWQTQLLSFAMEEFVRSLPAPAGVDSSDSVYGQIIRRLFAQLTQRTNNRGLSDEHRALNYLALRYPPVYHLTWSAAQEGKALIGVDTRPAHTTTRRVVAVRVAFRHASTHVHERYHCHVDITDEFPFLVSPLTLTYD
jgi:hypothetical protein